MYSQRRKNNQERWLTESGDPANDLIALQDSTPQLDWRYFVIELWIYVNQTSEQKGVNLFFHVKEFAQLLKGVPTKIIQLLIAPVDYQGSNFSALVFSGSRPSASPSKKQTREMRASPATHANQNSPSFTLCSFSFHVSLRFSTERATTRGSDTRSKTLICTCQSKCEWKWDGSTGAAECYGDRIQLLKAGKPGQ